MTPQQNLKVVFPINRAQISLDFAPVNKEWSGDQCSRAHERLPVKSSERTKL